MIDVQGLHQIGELLAVFGQIDGIHRRPDDRDTGIVQPASQVQRSLPAELHDHTVGLFHIHDVHHVLKSQRLEIQSVGDVVIRGDCFRVGIDHDRLIAQLLQRKRGVHAAIIELNPLPDPVRTAAEDHNLLFGPAGVGLHLGDLYLGLVFGFIRGIKVGRIGLEFRSAGVDKLKGGNDTLIGAQFAHGQLIGVHQLRQLRVAEPVLLGVPQRIGAQGPAILDLLDDVDFKVQDLGDVRQEPHVDLGQRVNVFQRPPLLQGILDVKNAGSVGFLQPPGHFVIGNFPVIQLVVQADVTDFQSPQPLLQRFLKCAADGHGLTDRFHLDAEDIQGLGKFFESETRNLDDAVINGRLK